jgi:2-polyprenyl-3-methyl-5-hydroxy-6-metoxy-1,4-benzoquinol methylase
LVAIREAVRKYIEESGNPDVVAYGGKFLRHYDRGAWMIRYMMHLGRMRGCRVLDVGCGFGWQALIIALAGPNDVVANDIRESMVNVVRSRTTALNGYLTNGGGAEARRWCRCWGTSAR